MIITKNEPPSNFEIKDFLLKINFELPAGYLDFIKGSNGANILFQNRYVELWPLGEIFYLNQEYKISEFAPEFFLIGSDGGGMAIGIKRDNGSLYEIPFILLRSEDAVFISNNIEDFFKEMDKKI